MLMVEKIIVIIVVIIIMGCCFMVQCMLYENVCVFMCRAENAGQYGNDRGGARFQRSQSQNDLDRQPYDDRLYSPTDFRASSSGYNIQRNDSQRQPDEILCRYPSDTGERYRRSYGEWDGAHMLPTAVDRGDTSRISAMEGRHQQMDQKMRSPSDPSRNLESSRHGDRRDYDGQRLHSAGNEFSRSHEDLAGVSKKPSVRTENPKNQDIINWLKRGDGSDHRPHDSEHNPDGRDMNRTASSYDRSVNDVTGDKFGDRTGYRTEPSNVGLSASRLYPGTGGDGEFVASSRMGLPSSPTSGPRTDREGAGFSQFGVSNPNYEAGHHSSVSEQMQSTENAPRGMDAGSQHQAYSRPDSRGLRTFSNDTRLSNPDRPDGNQIRGVGYVSPVYQQGASSRIPPPKPIHTIFMDSPSEDLPPSVPPKLASQQHPLNLSHMSPSPIDPFRRPAEALPRSVMVDYRQQAVKDDAREQVDSTPEYAVVQKRPVQSFTPDQAVDDISWHGNVEKPERPRADGAGHPSDLTSRSRQSPDGTLDFSDPSASRSNPAIQPLAVSVTSSSNFGKEQQGVKASSHEDLAGSPPVRPPLPSDDVLAVTGALDYLSAPARSEPQGGAENTDLQVCLLYTSPSPRD